jgi:hypothetical protein
MTDGSQAGRPAPGFVRIVLAVCLTASGCQGLPVVRQTPPPTSAPRVSTRSTVAPASPQPEAVASRERPLDLPTSHDDPAPVPPPRTPTPIIDAALERATLAELASTTPAAVPEVDPPSTTAATPAPETPAPETTPAPAAPPSREEEPKAEVEPPALPGDSLTIDRKADPPPIEPDRPTPGDPWRDALARLRTLARDRAGKPAPGEADPWSLRARLLDWIAEPGGNAKESTLWRTVLTALAAATGPETSDDPARGAEVRAAVEALEEHAPLAIADLRICRKVHGFGNFEPLDPARCRPGASMIVYCELEGLRYEPQGPMRRSRLSTRVELVPARGGEPAWSQDLGTAEDVCRRRRRDYYVNFRITLPPTLPPGDYELRLSQADEVAARSVAATIPMTVAP